MTKRPSTTTGQKWAKKTPKERVALFCKLRDELRDMADALGEAAEPGEKAAIYLAARTVAGAGVRVQSAIDLRQNPICCIEYRAFGSCQCASNGS